jgi:hypothetical protein
MGIVLSRGSGGRADNGRVSYERRCSVDELTTLALRIAANPTPGLLERWAAGMIDGNVLCPFGCGWDAWVTRVRQGDLEKLPWER